MYIYIRRHAMVKVVSGTVQKNFERACGAWGRVGGGSDVYGGLKMPVREENDIRSWIKMDGFVRE